MDRLRRAQSFVCAPFGEIAQPVLALLLFDQGAASGRESVWSIQFHILTIGENDGLARVHLRGFVSVTPEYVEPCRAIHRGDAAAGHPEDLFQERFQHNPFHFRKELLGRYVFAVGIFNAGETGKSAKPCAHSSDNEVRAGDAHLPECIHPLADDLFKVGTNLVFVGAGQHTFPFSCNQKNTGGKGGRVLGVLTDLSFHIDRPCLHNFKTGLHQSVD